MDSPFTFDTKRLHLRPIKLTDAEKVFDYRSMPEVYEYQNWKPTCIKDVEEFIIREVEQIPNRPDTWYQLVIINKDTNQLMGDIGIHFLGTESKQVEMGYTLSPKHQGVGYASEAVTGIIDYLFKTLHKQSIIASVDPRNQKSIRLLERTGLRQESHFRETFGFNNEWPDDLIYAAFAEEWIKNNPY